LLSFNIENALESERKDQTMTIEYWRSEIDEVDRELLRLLNRRVRLALKVGALKQAAGLPCCDPDRERDVLSTLQRANTGPLDGRAVMKLFRRIIEESRRVEMQDPLQIPIAEEPSQEAVNGELMKTITPSQGKSEGAGSRQALL
jgi:chorismate mutase